MLSTDSLPEDLLNAQVARLAVFAAVAVALWSIGLVMNRIVTATIQLPPGHSPARAELIEAIGIVLSILLFAYARYSRQAPQTKTDVSLAVMVMFAFLIAMLNSWAGPPRIRVFDLSWITILVL